MEHSLVPPAQLWAHGITVDVVPKQYSDGKSLHGIHHPDADIFIPFQLHGCISYFPTRLPTNSEIDNCRWVTFTSEAEWQPYSDHFAEVARIPMIPQDPAGAFEWVLTHEIGLDTAPKRARITGLGGANSML